MSSVSGCVLSASQNHADRKENEILRDCFTKLLRLPGPGVPPGSRPTLEQSRLMCRRGYCCCRCSPVLSSRRIQVPIGLQGKGFGGPSYSSSVNLGVSNPYCANTPRLIPSLFSPNSRRSFASVRCYLLMTTSMCRGLLLRFQLHTKSYGIDLMLVRFWVSGWIVSDADGVCWVTPSTYLTLPRSMK